MAVVIVKNKEVIVDDSFKDILSSGGWYINTNGYIFKTDYSNGKSNRKNIYFHRLVTKAMPDQLVDHINGNKLDNRLANLRICTNKQNGFNRRLASNNSSGYKGVSRSPGKSRWRAYININKVNRHIGCFNTKEKAAEAYNNAALELFGEYAWLNPIEGVKNVG